MEDGHEEAEGGYSYGGKMYRLDERESERWEVYDGERYLGVVWAKDSLEGPLYSIDQAGEEGKVDEPFTDDWRRAVETLIDRA